MAERIKNCPFCGAPASVKAEYVNECRFAVVECDVCLSRGEMKEISLEYCAKDEAIKLWNRRVKDDCIKTLPVLRE